MAKRAQKIDSLDRKVSIPDHVVYRSFASETIILNLETGKYHGLNATAATMLDVLKDAETMSDAVALIAGQYGQPIETVAADLRELCQGLVDRGLLELDTPTQRG
jgi:uncharacterized protein (UPF0371 family)